MSVLVSKFGGSSMADANGFRRVRALISAPARARFIVLSAPGRRHCMDDKVTDLLLLAHARAAEGGEEQQRGLGDAPAALDGPALVETHNQEGGCID